MIMAAWLRAGPNRFQAAISFADSGYQLFTAGCHIGGHAVDQPVPRAPSRRISVRRKRMMTSEAIRAGQPTAAGEAPTRSAVLWRKAQELEAAFLTEMLAHAGLDGSEQAAGGIGEEQFRSFMREAQAEAMVKAGGIGLAETLFRALNRAENVLPASTGVAR